MNPTQTPPEIKLSKSTPLCSKNFIDGGKETLIDYCQSLLPTLIASIQAIEPFFDVSFFDETLALTDFFLKKIVIAQAQPNSIVEPNGEAILFLAVILQRFKKTISELEIHAEYSISSRSRRFSIVGLNALLRQECRGTGEKNESGWTAAEKKEYQIAALDQLATADSRQLWTKIQCVDLACVPWDHFFKLFEKQIGVSLPPQDEAIVHFLMTKTGVNYIRPVDFANFLKAFDFGNLSASCVSNAKQMWFSTGFFPWAAASDAEKLLILEPKGTYVLTLSFRVKVHYELSVVAQPGNVEIILIRCDLPNGVYASKPEGNETFFKTMAHLLHQNGALTPMTNDILSDPAFCGDLTPPEAASLLKTCPEFTYLIYHDASPNGSGDGKPLFCLSYKLKDKSSHLGIWKTKEGYRIGPELGSKRLDKKSVVYFPSFTAALQSMKNLRYNFSLDNVPLVPVAPSNPCVGIPIDLTGPEKEKEGTLIIHRNFASCETIGGYPALSQGAILCDRFHVRHFGDRTVFALADGCNWGLRPRAAAQRAAMGFIEYMSDSKIQNEITNLNILKNHILRAFRIAHFKIIEDVQGDEIWTVSQSTLLAGVLLQLQGKGHGDNQYGVVFYSVGDCKLFLFNPKNGLRDLTYGNRANDRSAKDTGGRLGPYVDGGQPDLRNLKSFFWPLRNGDIILPVSDGVYDNFDPETLGIPPKQLKVPFETWSDVPADDVLPIKDAVIIEKMNEVVYKCKQKTPYFLSRALIQHGMNVTSKSRDFMDANPNTPEPEDHAKFPGKMDHITVIAIRAGNSFESQVQPKDKKKVLRDQKTKEALMKKIKDTGAMAFIRKSVKSLIPKVPLLKFRLEEHDHSVACSLHPVSLGVLAKSKTLSASGMTFSSIPGDQDPMCISDHFCVETTVKGVIAGLSSSSFAGSPEPSHKSVNAFVQHVKEYLEGAKDTIEVTDLMVDGLELAHDVLLGNPVFTSDNVTFAGSVCCKHPEDQASKLGGQFSIITVTVGAARAYYWDFLRAQLFDLTPGAPTYDNGTLGPWNSNSDKVNLESVRFSFHTGESRGIVFYMSPGVSQSFDPFFVGELEESVKMTMEDVEEKTRSWREAKLVSLLKKVNSSCVSDHVDVLLEYVNSCVQKYLDNEDEEAQIGAFFGHASVVAFRVGAFHEEQSSKTCFLKITKPVPFDKKQLAWSSPSTNDRVRKKEPSSPSSKSPKTEEIIVPKIRTRTENKEEEKGTKPQKTAYTDRPRAQRDSSKVLDGSINTERVKRRRDRGDKDKSPQKTHKEDNEVKPETD